MDAVEVDAQGARMAWKYETPWHRLGVQIPGNADIWDAVEAARMGFRVEKGPLWTVIDGVTIRLEDHFCLYRDDDKKILGTCEKDWYPQQNKVLFDFISEFEDKGMLSIETLGSLKGGKITWALCKILERDSFEPVKGDEVTSYIAFVDSKVPGRALLMFVTLVRIVCWNTLSMAVNRAEREMNQIFRHYHSNPFIDFDQATEVLDLACLTSEEVEKSSRVMTETPMTANQMDYYSAVLAIREVGLNEEWFKKGLVEDRPIITTAPDNIVDNLSTSRKTKHISELFNDPSAGNFGETVWDGFNAATQYTDHGGAAGGKPWKQSRFESSIIGQGAAFKRTAYETANEFCALLSKPRYVT